MVQKKPPVLTRVRLPSSFSDRNIPEMIGTCLHHYILTLNVEELSLLAIYWKKFCCRWMKVEELLRTGSNDKKKSFADVK